MVLSSKTDSEEREDMKSNLDPRYHNLTPTDHSSFSKSFPALRRSLTGMHAVKFMKLLPTETDATFPDFFSTSLTAIIQRFMINVSVSHCLHKESAFARSITFEPTTN